MGLFQSILIGNSHIAPIDDFEGRALEEIKHLNDRMQERIT